MHSDPRHANPPLLSDLVEQASVNTDRRSFLTTMAGVSLVVGGAALEACSPGTPDTPQSGGDRIPPLSNPNSKLDTSLHRGMTAPESTQVLSSATLPSFQRYDPVLPPLTNERTLRLQWHARETLVRISKDTVVSAWTFNDSLPGPIVHCREGDTVEFTLTNDVVTPHSMDFHAAQIDPKAAFRSVGRGQSVSFTFKPKWAGGFMYHCGSAPVLFHIGSGMYGAIIVSPREPLPAAKEFVLVQSEFYLGNAGANGVRPFDYQKMLSTLPDYLAFNGRPLQYVDAPIKVKVGDRVRFWVVNCGPTHPCSFHVVGEQFDTMYLGAPPGSAVRGVQTWAVAAGGGMCFELLCDVPGEFPFVNHGFGHGQKGTIGFLVVEP